MIEGCGLGAVARRLVHGIGSSAEYAGFLCRGGLMVGTTVILLMPLLLK
jgi:hypothetical protein